MKNIKGIVSITAAALLIPTTQIVSHLVGFNLKNSNPNDVDVTAGLAYLRPILLSAIATVTIIALIGFVSGILAVKKDDDKRFGKLGLVLLVICFGMLIVSNGIQNLENDVVTDAYKQKLETRN